MSNYFAVKLSWLGYYKHKAFMQWMASGYSDTKAHDEFIKYWNLANQCLAQSKRK
jgi:hypothetical protein